MVSEPVYTCDWSWDRKRCAREAVVVLRLSRDCQCARSTTVVPTCQEHALMVEDAGGVSPQSSQCPNCRRSSVIRCQTLQGILP